ncbi:TIGR00725 family protein [Lusitaniella coriacea]|uniref:TIGR00725 family protein n=1 Tax=Lusitaniella coriacea TaxID=1983105 RepID=UPI003CF9CD02
MRKIIIGVMGPGDSATTADLENAYALGQHIATKGWVLLTGGRSAGVMEAVSQGAKAAGGLTIGILPSADTEGISEAVDIAILSDLGNARNNINVLSSHVVIACGMGLGTASEVALALKNSKSVILLSDDKESQNFFRNLAPNQVYFATNPEIAIQEVAQILDAEISELN